MTYRRHIRIITHLMVNRANADAFKLGSSLSCDRTFKVLLSSDGYKLSTGVISPKPGPMISIHFARENIGVRKVCLYFSACKELTATDMIRYYKENLQRESFLVNMNKS